MASDHVCFTQDIENCSQFSFLSVDSGSELQKDQFSGIVGLAPASEEEKTTVPAFLTQMN